MLSNAADGPNDPSALLVPGPASPVEDQDAGDVAAGVDEDLLDEDEMDTDRVTSSD